MGKNMFSSRNLKIVSKNNNSKIVVSDNYETYLIVVNQNDKFEGLWSRGLNLIKSIILEEKNNKIESKSYSPDCIQINFIKKVNLQLYLLKNDKGLLAEIGNKSIITSNVRDYNLFFNIENDFEIIEKNISNIVVEYNLDTNDNCASPKKMYVGIIVDIDYDINDIEIDKRSIQFLLKPQNVADNFPYLYIVYDSDYKNLKSKMDISPAEIMQMKEEHQKSCYKIIDDLDIKTEEKDFEKAINMIVASSENFVMKKDGLLGIFAGFPWFNNYWGRDTFISLPGILLVKGKIKEAFEILDNFFKFQCKDKNSNHFGRIPNLILNDKDFSYNSIDSSGLFIREIYETFLYSNDYEKIIYFWDAISLVINEVYLKKKDSNNLLKHQPSETWMDTELDGKYPYSNRGCYAVEIQALWYTALYCAINLGRFAIDYFKNKKEIKELNKIKDDISLYENEAVKMKASINKYFISDKAPYIFDSLNDKYKGSNQIRPNCLIAFYFTCIYRVPKLFSKLTILKCFEFISKELIYKNGVATLSKDDKYFHPVHIDEHFNKDASYHNGIIWNWLSGMFIHTACRLGLNNFSYKQTQNIIRQITESESIGTLSEVIDTYYKDKINISGAFSQAWSSGELLRSFYQDYLGIRYVIPKRKIFINPRIPVRLGFLKTNIKFENDEVISFYCRMNKKDNFIAYMELKGVKLDSSININLKFDLGLNKNKTRVKIVSVLLCLKKAKDVVRINFESQENSFIKLGEINFIGSSTIIGVKTRYIKYESRLIDGIDYASDITEEQFVNFETMKNNKFLENYIAKN
jgi:glycogen debranching enzyme